MDFDRLPNEIFLQILQRLPFKDRVRVALVSRRFNYGSEMVISRTRALSLTAPIFRRADSKSMEKLIRLSAANLKELICDVPHESHGQYRSKVLEQFRMIAESPPPRLEVLNIDTECFKDLPLHDLLSQLPNLRTLEWFYPPSKFPDIVFEKVTRLKLRNANASFFASLAHNEYCPNVKHINLELIWFADEELALFSSAFAKWPALQTLLLELYPGTTTGMTLEQIDGLWELGSLQTLILEPVTSFCTDRSLEKISVAFPQLQRLQICPGGDVTSQGCTVLKKLKHLRHVTLWNWRNVEDIDRYIMELISCKRLEIIENMGGYPSTTAVSALAHRCPKLRRLTIWNIRYVRSSKDARSFVRSLNGFVQANLTIHITRGNAKIWECAQVRSALAGIHKSKNGRQLSIRVDDDEPYVPEPLVHEWDTDPSSRFDARWLRVATNGFSFGAACMRFGQRLVDAMLYLPRKMFKIFQRVVEALYG